MKIIHYNDRAAVFSYLDEAVHIVTELELADALIVPAFEKAVDLLSGKQVFFTQADAAETVARPSGLLDGRPLQ